MAGGVVLDAGLCAALGAVVFYARAHWSRSSADIRFARFSYAAAVSAQVLASAILLNAILTHQFQYTYVWSYSSLSLPLPLLVSTFYAGQEGSFMLWTLYTSLIGIALLRYSSRKEYEPEVMSVYSLILLFLFVILAVKSPFVRLWESFPSDVLQSGPIPPGMTNVVIVDAVKNLWARIPQDGRGLNPLLQNYWMVIHPQILFMGFSSMAVPYTMAIAGLWKKDYTSWIRVATPWSVFGAMVLGTGIIMGGYWAYETLGWGGFWGWDPVENSSLIPWLVCVASIHTTLTQRQSGAFVRTNFVLSLLTFVLVLYSTFLTRSGILGETSVHSFVDPGMAVYWMLLAFLVAFALLGFGMLLFRLREMPKVPVRHSVVSREFALFLGASALVFSAIFLVAGTSSPIISAILHGKASAVETSYYVRTNLPLGILITFLSGVGQFLWWRRTQAGPLMKRLAVPLVGGAVAAILVATLGAADPLVIAFVFCAGFSLVANAIIGYGIVAGNPRYAGGSIAHIGIAVMCIGFVTSAKYDRTQTVSLEKGKTVAALGYELRYTGYRQVDDERYAFNVDVTKDGRSHTVSPVFRYSEYTKGTLRYPDIVSFFTKDFYVAPVSVEEEDAHRGQNVDLRKNVPQSVAGLELTFRGFDLNDDQRQRMMEGGAFEIRAVVGVRDGMRNTTLPLVMRGGADGPEFVPAVYRRADGRESQLAIVQIKPNESNTDLSSVEVSVVNPDDPAVDPKPETLVVEATIKPYINLVWLGTLTLVTGFAMTMVRRSSENGKKRNGSA